MVFGFNSIFKNNKKPQPEEMHQEYLEMKEKTGFILTYTQNPDGLVAVSAVSADSPFSMSFPSTATDEAHIMFRQARELLRTRAAINQNPMEIKSAVEKLFSFYKPQ